jgi:predicted PurR-regulated permease PerM
MESESESGGARPAEAETGSEARAAYGAGQGAAIAHFTLRREDLARAQLLLLILFGLAGGYLILIILLPFLPAIVISAVFTVLVYPVYAPFERRIRYKSVAAFLGTLGVFFLVLAPMLGLSLMLLDQVRDRMDWFSQSPAELLAPGGFLMRTLASVAGRLNMDTAALGAMLQQEAQQLAGTAAARVLQLLSGIGGWLLQAGVALFTIFYFLRDADRLVRTIRWLIPLEPVQSAELLRRAREVTFATVYGSIVIAIVQGILGGLMFWAVGLPSPAVWGSMMGILALLPVIGPPVVWVPAVVILIASGALVRGIVLFVLGAVVLSSIDNVLRPYLVSGRTEIHPLVVFFSALGGIFVFGGVGLFVGPVLFVVALTLIEMARMALGPGTEIEPTPAPGMLVPPGE